MYGVYDIENFQINLNGVELGIFEEKGAKIYRRGNFEKLILSESGKVVVNPVEPVNLPKNITKYLLVDLKKKVVIEPKAIHKITLTFPIEIAVILLGKKSLEVLDVFSFADQRYTLYGDPKNGVICRYWQSDIFEEEKEYFSGKLEVEIRNSSNEWVELSKLVFDVYGMKIYYDESVTAFANVNVLSEKVAETEFVDEKAGRKSIELYVARKIPVISRKFVMEWGY